MDSPSYRGRIDKNRRNAFLLRHQKLLLRRNSRQNFLLGWQQSFVIPNLERRYSNEEYLKNAIFHLIQVSPDGTSQLQSGKRNTRRPHTKLGLRPIVCMVSDIWHYIALPNIE